MKHNSFVLIVMQLDPCMVHYYLSIKWKEIRFQHAIIMNEKNERDCLVEGLMKYGSN